MVKEFWQNTFRCYAFANLGAYRRFQVNMFKISVLIQSKTAPKLRDTHSLMAYLTQVERDNELSYKHCSQWQFLACRPSIQIRGDLAEHRQGKYHSYPHWKESKVVLSWSNGHVTWWHRDRRYLDMKTMCPILIRSQKSWHLYRLNEKKWGRNEFQRYTVRQFSFGWSRTRDNCSQ